MAKKAAGTSKSQAIRDYKKEHRKAKPKEIAAALSASGLSVTPQFVSTVLSNAKRKGTKGRRGAAGKAAGGDAYATLRQAKKLSDQMGGVEKARAALDALARILNA